jgi:hypothetical protein
MTAMARDLGPTITVEGRAIVERKLDALAFQPQTFADFERGAQELWAHGLRGEELVRALGGGEDAEGVVLRTPEELEAYFGPEGCASST